MLLKRKRTSEGKLRILSWIMNQTGGETRKGKEPKVGKQERLSIPADIHTNGLDP